LKVEDLRLPEPVPGGVGGNPNPPIINQQSSISNGEAPGG
jgi:hypothetical protein